MEQATARQQLVPWRCTGRFFKKNDGSFLVNATLSDPDARVGRRKWAQQKAAEREAEMPAEKRPRNASQWMEDERKKTELPKARDDAGETRWKALSGKASKADPADDDAATGKKKAKRLESLQTKKTQKVQKQADAAAKATDAASAALKGKAKAKDGQVSKAASLLIKKLRAGGSAADKKLLAVTAERVSGDPEKELDLFDVFFEVNRTSNDGEIKLLSLLSAVAVFRDLVPGYRIREATEQEKTQQRSAPVLALERYELKLLQVYRRLLPELEASMKKNSSATAPALAALVKAAFDFNYRQRLIGTAVKHANSPDGDVRRPVVEGLQEMVEGDQRLEASKEVVLAIGKIAQATAHGLKGPRGQSNQGKQVRGLQHELLKAWADVHSNRFCVKCGQSLYMPFQVLLRLQIGRAAQMMMFAGDWLRHVPPASLQPKDSTVGAVEKYLKVGQGLKASITQSPEQLRKAEAELLYEVFVVYLRILRQRHLHSRELLASILAGLARWGQQVNLELLLEILSELKLAVKDAIGQADELVALQGLNCALVLLSGPSQALITDVTWLSDAMTGALGLALPSLYSTHSEGEVWPPPRCFIFDEKKQTVRASDKELLESLETGSVPILVLRCLEAALKCPQGYGAASDAALASLVEMLFSLALTADSHVGIAFLKEVSLLLKRQRRLHTLLDAEGGIFGLGGISDRAVTVVWHLQALTCCLPPDVTKAAKALPASIPKMTVQIGDLFPLKDSRSWLATEVGRHVAAVSTAPAPVQKSLTRARCSFVSEAELRAVCGDIGVS
ncbi:unnamed protein product [Polarella glacialis]|uniref:Nucleolar complex-associated protein 3 N-terminal domain-containing protein n=1 Tax=Polarella glacialis TaxID=89957 RepID=A0A813HNB4_POLGL|nr:unnamed protein product [Polarella glacialis]